jgi:hypothetical protein
LYYIVLSKSVFHLMLFDLLMCRLAVLLSTWYRSVSVLKTSLPLPMHYHTYIASNIELASIVCRNKCMRLSSKIIVDQSHYSDGKKYCRRCKHDFITEKVFCECCGMQLRTTPMISTYKRILRKKLGTVDQKAAGRNNIPGSGSRI